MKHATFFCFSLLFGCVLSVIFLCQNVNAEAYNSIVVQNKDTTTGGLKEENKIQSKEEEAVQAANKAAEKYLRYYWDILSDVSVFSYMSDYMVKEIENVKKEDIKSAESLKSITDAGENIKDAKKILEDVKLPESPTVPDKLKKFKEVINKLEKNIILLKAATTTKLHKTEKDNKVVYDDKKADELKELAQSAYKLWNGVSNEMNELFEASNKIKEKISAANKNIENAIKQCGANNVQCTSAAGKLKVPSRDNSETHNQSEEPFKETLDKLLEKIEEISKASKEEKGNTIEVASMYYNIVKMADNLLTQIQKSGNKIIPLIPSVAGEQIQYKEDGAINVGSKSCVLIAHFGVCFLLFNFLQVFV